MLLAMGLGFSYIIQIVVIGALYGVDWLVEKARKKRMDQITINLKKR